MLPNREGLFHAYPVDIGISETRENKLLQVVISYHLFEELAGEEWVDCTAESFEITGYHTLECKDGSLCDWMIDALKAALGWDGRDPFWLQDNAADLAQKPVQVKLAFEEYNDATRIKVQFLNPYGSHGGVAKADEDMRRSAGNRLGSKFRALAGGTPAQAPKPAGRPTPAAPTPAAAPAPKPAPPKAPAATAEAPTPATMEQAWEEFCKHCDPAKWSQQDVEKEWFRILAELFPGKQPDQLTPAEWGVMKAEGPDKIIPF